MMGGMSESMTPSVVLDLVVLDTDEPLRLAEFYSALFGWVIVEKEADWVTVRPQGQGSAGIGIAFQLAINHTPPTWPSGTVPQQVHLDLNVTDRPAAERFAESLGARRVPGVTNTGNFTVFVDPSGHPFCLCDG